MRLSPLFGVSNFFITMCKVVFLKISHKPITMTRTIIFSRNQTLFMMGLVIHPAINPSLIAMGFTILFPSFLFGHSREILNNLSSKRRIFSTSASYLPMQ